MLAITERPLSDAPAFAFETSDGQIDQLGGGFIGWKAAAGWQAAQRAVQTLPRHPEPALPRDYMLELMRKEKVAMASAQAFGNLNNMLVPEGLSPDEIVRRFSGLATKKSLEYSENLGVEPHLRKMELAEIKNEVFLTTKTKKHGP